jgi:CDGSH-type Zn-finger protein
MSTTTAEFHITPNGPLKITGYFRITDGSGKPLETREEEVLLCRCGGSNNKPFCDGSHKTNGFRG